MKIKYNINDIVAYNHQGTFEVGIIVKILVLGELEVIYGVSTCVDILEENIVKLLGNAKEIKDAWEVGDDY